MLRFLNKADADRLYHFLQSLNVFENEQISYIKTLFMKQEEEYIWLAFFSEDELNGIAYCIPEEMTNRTWNLVMLFIKPEQQKKGLGRVLVNRIEDILRERCQRLLIVETSSKKDFEGARTFYKRIGFKKEGTICDFYDDNDSKVTFSKKLL